MNRNYPVLLTVNGARQIAVYPGDLEFTYGGQCTGRTRAGARCKNPSWDRGQVATYRTAYAGDLLLRVYGPLPGDANDRYAHQRCQHHDTPDAVAYCDPEWEPFNPERHHHLATEPTLGALFGADEPPPTRLLAAALRNDLDPNARQLLAELLTDPS